jgi:hypothetical protein
MISLEDCVGLSGLTEEEVLAIAEHEHIPEIAATCHAPEEVEALKGSMKVVPRGPVPVRGKDQPLQTLAWPTDLPSTEK